MTGCAETGSGPVLGNFRQTRSSSGSAIESSAKANIGHW